MSSFSKHSVWKLVKCTLKYPAQIKLTKIEQNVDQPVWIIQKSKIRNLKFWAFQLTKICCFEGKRNHSKLKWETQCETKQRWCYVINETFQYSVSEKAGKLLERIDVCFELRTSNAHTLQPGVSGGSAIFSDPNRQKKQCFRGLWRLLLSFFNFCWLSKLKNETNLNFRFLDNPYR